MSGKIIKPDGTDAQSEPVKFKIHEIDLQSPSDKASDLAKMAMVAQRDPVTGQTITGLAITPAQLMIALETYYALQERDAQIAHLESRLESVQADMSARIAELENRLDEVVNATDQRISSLEDGQ